MSEFLTLWQSMSEDERRNYVSGLSEPEQAKLLRLLKGEEEPKKAQVLSPAHRAKMEMHSALPTEGVTKPDRGFIRETIANVTNPAKAFFGGMQTDLGELGMLASAAPIALAHGGPGRIAPNAASMYVAEKVAPAMEMFEGVAERGRQIQDRAVSDADTTLGAFTTGVSGGIGEFFWDAVGAATGVGVAKGLAKTTAKSTSKLGKSIHKASKAVAEHKIRDIDDFTPSGHLPDEAHQRRVIGTSRVRHNLHEATIEADNLDKAIKGYIKEKNLNKKTAKPWLESRVEQALHTRNGVEELPDMIKEAARPMRVRLDAMSKEMVHGRLSDGSFAIDRDLRSIVQSNFGRYMHESYKGFDDPSYGRWLRSAKNIPESEAAAKWEGAREHIMARHPYLNDAEVEGRLHALADFDKDPPFFSFNTGEPMPTGYAVGRKRKLTRHGTDQKLREFLGEYDNPRPNFLRSIAHTSHMLEHARYVDELVPILEKYGLASRGKPTAVPGQKYANSALVPGTERYGKPVYTHPEVAKAMEFSRQQSSHAVYGMLNALLKGNKTIWSAKTQARNFMSSMVLTWANGNLVTPFSKAGREMMGNAWDVGRYGMGYDVLDSKQTREIADLLMENGILNGNVDVGDFRYQQGRLSGWLEDGELFPNTRAKVSDAAGGASKALKVLGDKPAALYQFGDNYWKVVTYQQEFRKALSAYMKAGNPDDVARAMAQNRALEVTRDTVQNYNQLSPFAQKIRDAPAIGAFSSFPLESARNFEKIIEHSIREIRDPALREIGIQRALSFGMTVFGLPAALTGAGIWRSNVSYDQLEAARELVADYDQNANMVPVRWDEDEGKMTLINTSHFQYFANIKNPIQAIISGAYSDRDAGDIAQEVVTETLGPVFGPDLATGQVLEMAKRSDYLPLKDNLGRAAYQMAPGAVTTDILPALRAAEIPGVRDYLPPTLRSGRNYRMREELANYLGVRVIQVDAKSQGKFRLGRARMRLNRVRGILTQEIEQQRSPVKIAQARAELRQAWEREAPGMIRVITAMRKLGVDDKFIEREALRNLRREDRKALLAGEVPTVYD